MESKLDPKEREKLLERWYTKRAQEFVGRDFICQTHLVTMLTRLANDNPDEDLEEFQYFDNKHMYNLAKYVLIGPDGKENECHTLDEISELEEAWDDRRAELEDELDEAREPDSGVSYEKKVEIESELGKHEEALQEAVSKSEEPEYQEVAEWWLITDSRLVDLMKETGRVILDNDFGSWWGRTCSGQSVYMDGAIQEALKRSEMAQYVSDDDLIALRERDDLD